MPWNCPTFKNGKQGANVCSSIPRVEYQPVGALQDGLSLHARGKINGGNDQPVSPVLDSQSEFRANLVSSIASIPTGGVRSISTPMELCNRLSKLGPSKKARW